jgi:hypothetical protein
MHLKNLSFKINSFLLKQRYGSEILTCNKTKFIQRYIATNINSNETIIKTYTNNKISYATTSNSDFTLLPDTLRDLLEKRALETPSNISFAFPHNGLKLSFLELEQRVKTMANSFLKLGFKKGDRFAIILPNTHEFIVTLHVLVLVW